MCLHCDSNNIILFQLNTTSFTKVNPLNTELNPICHLLALLGAHHILHVSRIRVKYSYTFIVLYIQLDDGYFNYRVRQKNLMTFKLK